MAKGKHQLGTLGGSKHPENDFELAPNDHNIAAKKIQQNNTQKLCQG